MKLKIRKFLGIFIRYGLGIAILVYFFEKNDFHWGMLKGLLVPQTFLVLILLKLSVYILISLRWWRILRELSVKATVGQSVSFSFLAIFFAYFLPGNMSSDVAKGFFASRVFGAPGRIVFAIVIDRVVGLVSLMVLLFFGVAVFSLGGSPQFDRIWALMNQAPWHYFTLGGVVALGAAAGLWYFIKSHAKFVELKKVLLELKSFQFWLEILGLSLISHVAFAGFLAYTAYALNLENIDMLGCVILFPLSTLAMIVPLTPGSLGVGQVLYEYLFDTYAGAPTQASLLFTTAQVMDLIFMIYGAWYFSRLLKLKKKSTQ